MTFNMKLQLEKKTWQELEFNDTTIVKYVDVALIRILES